MNNKTTLFLNAFRITFQLGHITSSTRANKAMVLLYSWVLSATTFILKEIMAEH